MMTVEPPNILGINSVRISKSRGGGGGGGGSNSSRSLVVVVVVVVVVVTAARTRDRLFGVSSGLPHFNISLLYPLLLLVQLLDRTG